jgi:hypothetical protein
LPKKLVEAGQEMTAVAAETKSGFHLRRMPNSIDTSFAYKQFRNRREQKA